MFAFAHNLWNQAKSKQQQYLQEAQTERLLRLLKGMQPLKVPLTQPPSLKPLRSS